MKPLRRHLGFSLIELMIVLVIIGIATAAISLHIAPDPAEALRIDARELALRLSTAQQEVRIDGRVIVWEAQRDGYQFMRGTWAHAPDSVVPVISTDGALDRFMLDDALHPRRWRAGVVHVMPGAPLLLTSEWIDAPRVIELRSGPYRASIVRTAGGSFQVQ